MKHYLFPLVAVILCLFTVSCGDNPILDVNQVEKSDLTSPLFLAFDNTLDKSTKKIWAFSDAEAVKGTITVVGTDVLSVNAEWYFTSWSLSGKILTLNEKDGNKRTYELNQVSVLGYNAISFGTAYVCIPSTNRGLDGVRYEDDWYNRGLTDKIFWDAMRKSYEIRANVEIKLNK